MVEQEQLNEEVEEVCTDSPGDSMVVVAESYLVVGAVIVDAC